MKKLIVMFFLIGLPVISSGQKLDMSLVENMQPRNIGPAGMSGRITAIDVVTSNPDIIYAGSASGGLWKSESGGVAWKPLFENEATASIGAVAIQQSNPAVVWVGTGEGNPRNSLNGGLGIYKSLDGGKTWKKMGLENTRHIHRVIIDPQDPNTVYAAAIGSPWGAHPERGVFRTKDGGETWEKVLFKNNRTGAAELVMDPTNPNKMIAAMWEHNREPWFFSSGGPGSGMHITYDGGDTWKEITSEDGLPEGELGRIGLAIAPSEPNIVYSYVEAKKNALYRSEDGGESWKKVNDDMSEIGNRPFYYAEIYVAPNNENRVYSIFTFVNVSQDGGKTFEELMPAYGANNGIHPDHHAWYIHPENPDFMIDGNDGGLNITRDGGDTWRFVETLPIGQFYHVSVDSEYPYNVYGGLQDNGSWRGPAYVWKSQGIRNSYWQEISFGDGFDVVPDKEDSRYGWSMSQQGYVSRYDRATGKSYTVRPTHPDPEVELRFNWNAAINMDPFDNSTLYFGSQYVHKSTDKGLTWQVISGDLTTNDPEKQKQMESGGLTMDATGAENHTSILVIEPSPVEQGMIWSGSDDGKVFFTQDKGQTWNDVSRNLKGLPEGSWIAQIKASAKNKGEALLIANNYRRDDYTPYAFRTRNYGESWERIVDQDDVLSFTLSIVEDVEEPNLMFLGTDDGLYVSIDAAKNWQKWTSGFPTVPVSDMIIHPREQDLVIGTFGRSVWVMDDLRPLRALAEKKRLLENATKGGSPQLELFESPTGYLASYQQPSGRRFGADATYHGENRNAGGRITYFLVPGDKQEKQAEDNELDSQASGEQSQAETSLDSISLNIYDGERLIRTLTRKAPDSAGLHRITWNLDEKGVDRPSREIKESNNEKGGVNVRPGTYKLVMRYGDLESTSSIKVASDPRLDIDRQAISEIYKTAKTLEAKTELAANIVKQLVESKKSAEEFIEELNEENKKEIEASEEIIKQIDEKIALFLGAEDERQGITRSREMNVANRLSLASTYVRSRPTGITPTERQLIDQAENELREAVQEVNTFFESDWKGYRSQMEQVELSRFEEVVSFEVE